MKAAWDGSIVPRVLTIGCSSAAAPLPNIKLGESQTSACAIWGEDPDKPIVITGIPKLKSIQRAITEIREVARLRNRMEKSMAKPIQKAP